MNAEREKSRKDCATRKNLEAIYGCLMFSNSYVRISIYFLFCFCIFMFLSFFRSPLHARLHGLPIYLPPLCLCH